MRKVVLITGGFDPLHSGHIAFIKAAKKLGDILVVGVNSDAWLTRKKGAPFMSFYDRVNVVRNILDIDIVIEFNDDDNTSKHAIEIVREAYLADKIIFANGGDRTAENTPEIDFADDNLEFVFGVGGAKTNSSSELLDNWRTPRVNTAWGQYKVLHETSGLKVKEIIINPGKSLPMQRHRYRDEFFIVDQGAPLIHHVSETGQILPSVELNIHKEYRVPNNSWYQLTNPTEDLIKLIEVQRGEFCIEEDVEIK